MDVAAIDTNLLSLGNIIRIQNIVSSKEILYFQLFIPLRWNDFFSVKNFVLIKNLGKHLFSFFEGNQA